MYKIDEKFFQNLLKDYSRIIVGRLCKQIELLSESKERSIIELTEKQKFDILKTFSKEFLYEYFRDIEGHVKAYTQGKRFESLKIYNPTTEKL